MNQPKVKALITETFKEWTEDRASRLAASLAYYTVFSLPALLLISLAIAGRLFERDVVKERILAQARSAMGSSGAEAIGAIFENASTATGGTLAVIIGVIVLFLGASGVFGQLQAALNTIWEVEPRPGRGILETIRGRLFSFTVVLGIGFLLLVSLVLDAVLAIAGDFLSGFLPGSIEVAQILNYGLSAVLTFGLIAAMFKVIPDVKIGWRDVWLGALVTTILFFIARLLMGLYLGSNATASAYGAAGSLVLLLLWIYASAQILFLGAEFTQVHARLSGAPIEPDENALALTEGTRIQQGMPKKETVARKQEEAGGRSGPQAEERVAVLTAAPGSPRLAVDRQQPEGPLAKLRPGDVVVVLAIATLAYVFRDRLLGPPARAS